jgi:hypothetical protein
MRALALSLVVAGLAACGDLDSSCIRFNGDTGLVAGVCSDGESCNNFARSCDSTSERTASR